MKLDLTLSTRRPTQPKRRMPRTSGSWRSALRVRFRRYSASVRAAVTCSISTDLANLRSISRYGFGVPPLELIGSRFPTVQQLAAVYVAKMRELQPHGSTFVRSSVHGLRVYEMAVLLAKIDEPVGVVAMIDTLHPAFRRNLSTLQRVRFLSVYIADRIAKYARNLTNGRIDRLARDALDFVVHAAHAGGKSSTQVRLVGRADRECNQHP